MAEMMVRNVLEGIRDFLAIKPGMAALDVYCGAGLFSAFLAPLFSRPAGVDPSPQACEDFAANLDEFDHVELYEASAGAVLSHLDLHPRPGSGGPAARRTGSHRPRWA